MNRENIDLLISALTRPERLIELNDAEWDSVIQLARSANVISRLGAIITERGMMEKIPKRPRMHLASSAAIATRQRQELMREIKKILEALSEIDIPVVLLKGAAYAYANLPASTGRMVSDVDILVPHDALGAVESALMMRGWISAAKTPYDQHYYRTWMHELPPMRNFRRGTVIDVHHAILPTSARRHPSSIKLLSAATSVSCDEKIKVLAPVDMLLHSATHLFHESEFDNGFRDLIDLDSLIRSFDAIEGFWGKLIPRAAELELLLPLFYAFRYTKAILNTPIPPDIQVELDSAVTNTGVRLNIGLLDFFFLRVLQPQHRKTADRFTPFSKWALYIRGHWLRMTPLLLAYHLCRKSMMNLMQKDTKN